MIYPSLTVSSLFPELDLSAAEQLCSGPVDRFEANPRIFPGDTDGTVALLCAEKLRKAGKCFYSFHLPYDGYDVLYETDEMLRQLAVKRNLFWIRIAEKMGCRLVVVHPSPPGSGNDDRAAHVRQLRRSLRELQKSTVLKLALENLCGDRVGGSVEDVLEILSAEGLEKAGVCLDVNHLRGDYAVLPEKVDLLGDRLCHIHASDFGGGKEMHWFPGTGVIGWQEFASALRRNGYGGSFNYELKQMSGLPEKNLRRIRENFDALFPPEEE